MGASDVGEGIANVFSKKLLELPMLRLQLMQEQQRADREQQYRQQQNTLDQNRLTEEKRYHDLLASGRTAAETGRQNRFEGTQAARDRALKEKISEFDAAQELRQEEDDARASRAADDAKFKQQSQDRIKSNDAWKQSHANAPKEVVDASGRVLRLDAGAGTATQVPVDSSGMPPQPKVEDKPSGLSQLANGIKSIFSHTTAAPGAPSTVPSPISQPPVQAPLQPGAAPPLAPGGQPPVPVVAPTNAPVSMPQPQVGAPIAAPSSPPVVAAPPPVAAAPQVVERVKVKSSNGQIGTIPKNQLQDAMAQGFILAQ